MRLLGHTIVAASAAVVALLVAPACADNDQSIFIRTAIAPPEGSCLYTSDATQAGLFEGVIDIALRDHYDAVLLVGNQMIQRGDILQPRTEPNRAKITGAVVRVTDPNDSSFGEFTSVAAGFVEVAQGTVPSFGPVSVIAIDAPTLAKIGAGLTPGGPSKLVVTHIKVFGETIGGVDIESDEFDYPVRVCRECLISFAGSDDPLTNGVDCNLQAATGGTGGGATDATVNCHPGQDGAVQCTQCQNVEYPAGSKLFPCRTPTVQ